MARGPTQTVGSCACLSDSVERHADWLELCALGDTDGNASHSDLLRALHQSGSVDAYEEPDDEIDEEWGGIESSCSAMETPGLDAKAEYEAAADDTLGEISWRERACGGDGGGYPFEIGDNHIRLLPDTDESVYVFLLLLSAFGPQAGPQVGAGAELFEDLCAEALQAYLGGEHTCVGSLVFGFPRRILPRGFPSAVDMLCRALGEGQGHRSRPTSGDQKDGGLDVVAWRSFYDRRAGQLIVFGGCAAGDNWQEKLTELQPAEWCRLWMLDQPAVDPVRLFFVPHSIEEKTWLRSTTFGGILFERCRISSLLPRPSEQLAEGLHDWSRFVIDHKLREED